MDLMPGILDLTQPNYKNCEVYGKISTSSYVVGALTITSLVKATLDSANYVKGAIKVNDRVEEEINNG